MSLGTMLKSSRSETHRTTGNQSGVSTWIMFHSFKSADIQGKQYVYKCSTADEPADGAVAGMLLLVCSIVLRGLTEQELGPGGHMTNKGL